MLIRQKYFFPENFGFPCVLIRTKQNFSKIFGFPCLKIRTRHKIFETFSFPCVLIRRKRKNFKILISSYHALCDDKEHVVPYWPCLALFDNKEHVCPYLLTRPNKGDKDGAFAVPKIFCHSLLKYKNTTKIFTKISPLPIK